ncbi:GNAT family N-acetyltransferase [Pigmentibacter ruber]|uniref:GNAT family N-acetyltransferase n=1 Tax=Pigmentibacter ruber TaxID=2683196 RepID=UPI00131E44C9|nr:GNAT family N-acetyltransferase [Pigmentibacter ruber]
MKNNLLNAINFYNDLFSDVITNEIVLERFKCYYQNNSVPLWNTVFHNNTYYSYEDILGLFSFYSTKKIKGYFLSFDSKYQEFSIYNGAFFSINKFCASQDFLLNPNFSVREIKDSHEFCRHLFALFEIDTETQKDLSIMLSLKDRKFKNKNYCAYFDNTICATITIAVNESENAYLYNLAIFPEFRKKNLASQFIYYLLKEFSDKNIFTLTAANSVLSQFSLPNLGFERLGDINLIPLEKMKQAIQDF